MANLSAPVLVLGATGGFGGAMALELLRREQPVRALARSPQRVRERLGEHPALELVAGDAQQIEQLGAAAAKCRAIVHGVNYPYHLWEPHMTRVTANVLEAARGARATVLFPGNVYAFGPGGSQPLAEDAQARPTTRKGALRKRLEDLLHEHADKGRVRSIVLRAGDYYGPTVRNPLVNGIFANALRGRPLRVLGRLDVAHQWAFTPDLARVGVDLLTLSGSLSAFEVVHFAGHVVPAQSELLRLAAERAGHPDLPVRRIPWWLLRAAGLFQPVLRELVELRYLFEQAVIIDDPRRRALLPDFKPTALTEAVDQTLDSYRGA